MLVPYNSNIFYKNLFKALLLKITMSLYKERILEKTDYSKQYLQLLKQLSIIEPDNITEELFFTFVDNLSDKHQIYVIEDTNLNIIIGTITILIEPKLIHTMGFVCHIEDVVVHKDFRGLKLCKKLINKGIEVAKNYGCYKIILDCSDLNIGVYQKCGFTNNGNQMSLYL
jgi:glucosamine-phosphate N-acetyltransferase